MAKKTENPEIHTATINPSPSGTAVLEPEIVSATSNSTALVPKQFAEIETNYGILKQPPLQLKQILKDNLGTDIEASDLEMIKTPSAGGLAWTIQTLDGPAAAADLKGIIVYWKQPRAFWSSTYTGGHVPPDCISKDNLSGIGTPGGNCENCKFNQWGSAKLINGKETNAKACRQSRQLFLLQEENLLPVLVRLPPSSIKETKNFFLQLAQKMESYYSIEVSIKLTQDKSSGGVTFSKAQFKKVRKLTAEEQERINFYRNSIISILDNAIDINREDYDIE